MELKELLRRACSDLWVEGPQSGWAFDSLRRTLRRALLLAVCGWQVVMLWAVVNTPLLLHSKALLGIAHLGLMILALLARSGRFPAWIVLVLVYPLALWDWAATESIEGVLAFAACWLCHLTAAAINVVLQGRRAIALTAVAAFGTAVGIHLINPHWVIAMPFAVGVTSLTIMAAVRLGLPFLLNFASQADAAAAAAEDEVRNTAALRAASGEAAEDARILHDTVINTLSAIANGGAGVNDLDAVRERCTHDAALVEEMSSSVKRRNHRDTDLRGLFDAPGLEVIRTGADDTELSRLERELPDHVIVMIVRAAKEALQNVGKHAAVQHVAVDVRIERRVLIIKVADEGIGFDGQVPTDRGIANSVLSRADEAGVAVTIDTSLGVGTTLTFRKDLDEVVNRAGSVQLSHQLERNAEDIVASLRQRAGWLWISGLTAVGFVIEPLNRVGQWTASYPMLVLIAIVASIAWFSRDSAGQIRGYAIFALAVAASLAFGLSVAAVDFGRSDVVFWQAIGSTGPLVLIIAAENRHRVKWASLGLFTATVLVTTVIVWQDSPDAASIIPVGGLACLGLVAAWLGFQRAIAVVGAQASRDQHAAFRSRVDAAVRIAADEARGRWRAAGLHESVELLRSVADGEADPLAPSTRAACATEEAYLRQLTQLNPDLVRMGHWFAQALYQARAFEGRLLVRTGEVDVPDDETAADLGAVLLSAVSAVPQGAVLSASIFPSPAGLRMTLVSPHPHLDESSRVWSSTPGTTMSYRTIDSQDLLEILVHSAD